MRFWGKKKEREEEKELNEGIPSLEEIMEEVFAGTGVNYKEFTKDKEENKTEQKEPQTEKEVLIEILKELKELNQNVKAVIVRMDINEKRAEEFRKAIIKEVQEIPGFG